MTQNEITQILHAINELSLNVNSRLDSIEKRLDRIEVRMDVIESKMDQLEKRMDAIELRMDKLEKRLDKVEARLDRVDAKLTLLEQRLSQVEKVLHNVAVEVIDHRVNISNLVTQEQFIEFRSLNLTFHDDTKAALVRLEQEMTALIASNKNINKRVNVLEKA